jgi:SNF2 family DNA or RNA helicase
MILPPLWPHQQEAIQRAGDKFALFFDPGCGKTRTAIEIRKQKAPLKTKTIIFAPLNVCRNWEKELGQFFGVKHNVYLVAGQTKTAKLKALKGFAEYGGETPTFLICNIESVRSAEYLSLLILSRAQFIIIDEAHNFKNSESKQTKGLLTLVDTLKPKNLYLLTGTPAPQGEMDLYIPFTLLERNKKSFFQWRREHFYDKNERRRGMQNYWPEYIINDRSRVVFQRMLGEISAVAKKSEVLDLPPFIYTTLYHELSKEQRQHYASMLDYLFAIDNEGNELNASNFLARNLRLQQILAGHLGEVAIKDNSRLKVLDEAIDKVGNNSFIIWTIFKSTYAEIAELLNKRGISYGLLTGDQSAQERFDAMNAFEGGAIRCLIAHPRAGGVGVNLVRANYSIFYLRNYSLTDYLQAQARNYRGGSEQHERITQIDIVAANTIDEEIVESLRRKESIQDFILRVKEKHERSELE